MQVDHQPWKRLLEEEVTFGDKEPLVLTPWRGHEATPAEGNKVMRAGGTRKPDNQDSRRSHFGELSPRPLGRAPLSLITLSAP